ncbi:MAG: hypothetical protein ACFFFB_00695 [Candidatus Heimdallarchaeota archaeon]
MKMYHYKKQILIFFVVFLCSSFSFVTFCSVQIYNPKNNTEELLDTGITIYALDDDNIIKSGINLLENKLQDYADVETKVIDDLNSLDVLLDCNPHNYIILFGHSNEESLLIHNAAISWNNLVDVTSKYNDKLIILPTCSGLSIYQHDFRALDNIIAPFISKSDYRIGLDFTLLTLSLYLNEEKLFEDSLTLIEKNSKLLTNPEHSLFLTLAAIGSYDEPGKGYIDIYNVFLNQYYNEEFLLESSARLAIHAALEILLGHPPIGAVLNFLFELYMYYVNLNHFIDFFQNTVGNWIFDYGYDRGTHVDYLMIYDWPYSENSRIIYYLLVASITRFTLYSPKYAITSTSYRRDIWEVRMCVALEQVYRIHFLNWDFSFLETEIILWNLDAAYTRIYYLRPHGGIPR